MLAMVSLATGHRAEAQTFEIGIIDFYGLSRISRDDVRAVLPFAEGDTVTLSDDQPPAAFRSAEDHLRALNGVASARVNVACCDAGRVIVYVGIQERGAPTLRLRRAPGGTVRLPAEVVRSPRNPATRAAAGISPATNPAVAASAIAIRTR